jgi:hypothetical protein
MSGDTDLGGFHEVRGLTNLFGNAPARLEQPPTRKAVKPAKNPVRVAAGKKAARTRVPYVRGHVVLKSDPSRYALSAEKSAKFFQRLGMDEVFIQNVQKVERVTNLGYLGPMSDNDPNARIAAAYDRKVNARRTKGWRKADK